MAGLTVTSHTFNTNQPVLSVTSIPSGLKIGDCLKLAGGTLQPVMTDDVCRVTALNSGAKAITVQLILGNRPTASGSGNGSVVNIGCAASVGTGDAADGWKKTVASQVWREDNDANIAPGATFALGFMKASGGIEYVRNEPDVSRFAGQTIAFGGIVKHLVKGGSGSWCVYIESDGTGGATTSSADATSAAFTWEEVTATIPADATYVYVGMKFKGVAGDVYCLCNPVLTVGTDIGANAYIKPSETFKPVVKIEPWINRAIDFTGASYISGFGYYWADDIVAGSGIRIASTIVYMTGNIEAINTNPVVNGVGGSRLIGFSDGTSGAITLGSTL